MTKLKSHKGLLKRIKITARKKVKFHKAYSGHLRSGKGGDKLQKLRRPNYAKRGDVTRLEKILHMNLKPIDAAPQPRRTGGEGRQTTDAARNTDAAASPGQGGHNG